MRYGDVPLEITGVPDLEGLEKRLAERPRKDLKWFNLRFELTSPDGDRLWTADRGFTAAAFANHENTSHAVHEMASKLLVYIQACGELMRDKDKEGLAERLRQQHYGSQDIDMMVKVAKCGEAL